MALSDTAHGRSSGCYQEAKRTYRGRRGSVDSDPFRTSARVRRVISVRLFQWAPWYRPLPYPLVPLNFGVVPFRTVSLRICLRDKRACESCVEIDARIDLHRQLVRSTTDPSEIERLNRLIAQLYADRVRLHKNPE